MAQPYWTPQQQARLTRTSISKLSPTHSVYLAVLAGKLQTTPTQLLLDLLHRAVPCRGTTASGSGFRGVRKALWGF